MKTNRRIRRLLDWVDQQEAGKKLERDKAKKARTALRDYHRANQNGDKHGTDRALERFVGLFVRGDQE